MLDYVLKGVNMDKEQKDFPIFVVMTTYIIILLMYLWTYKQGSPLLWGFFVIERLMSFSYESQVDIYLATIELDQLKGRSVVAVLLFTLLSVGIFLYTPFKYPGLFWILVIGELIDLTVKGIRNRIKKH